MSQGGTKERKTLGATKGSTPFRVESIDDGAHHRWWPFLPGNYRTSIIIERASLFDHIQSFKTVSTQIIFIILN